MKPDVSVIMPTYNMASYLKEAIDSILGQSYKGLELIVIDDASTDQTWNLLCTYSDPRLHCFRNSQNKGNYPSRNEGMRIAQGRYISVMDADDVALSDKVAIQLAYMDTHPEVLACGSLFTYMGSEKKAKRPLRYPDLRLQLLKGNRFLHSSLFVRTSVLHELGGYDERYRYSSDYDLVCRLALTGEIVNLPEVLVRYRLHDTQISSSHYMEQQQYAFEIRRNYQLEMIRRFKCPEYTMPVAEEMQNGVMGEIIFYCHCGKRLKNVFWTRIVEKLAIRISEGINVLPKDRKKSLLEQIGPSLSYLCRNGILQNVLFRFDVLQEERRGVVLN